VAGKPNGDIPIGTLKINVSTGRFEGEKIMRYMVVFEVERLEVAMRMLHRQPVSA
jgi:hypothetical protein